MAPYMMQPSDAVNIDYLDPSKNVELNEEELNEIYSRPHMNPNHARMGHKPQSNLIYSNEQSLIESKREKVIEIFKQCTEVFEILEAAKRDPLVIQATGGKGLDPTSMVNDMMMDKHFNNLLGDFLNKRPGAKKVEIFMAKQLQAKINEITLEMKIKSKCFPGLSF
jgi:hypothetical protein